jgi:DNA polymerase-3 subunit gamma/tau
MSYVVLARKYRPKNFAEMVGQAHVVQALGNALTTQRLHHAYLFTGTRGVGKTTVARILAKSLNCSGPDGLGTVTATPCGVCDACRDIDAGRFVDYTELDAASNRGVDEVQALLEQAVYKPVQGRFKVFMIDEVHMLTNTAFNAMLKTLEEPPEYLKFVLATTDPQKVPVTVLSRCLQFNLRPMAPDTVAEHLQRVLQAESVAADAGSLHALAKAARGSMRDALSLTDQAIAFGGGKLEDAVVRQMLGAADRDHVWQLIEAVALADGAAIVATVDRLRVQGHSGAATLDEMIATLQRMAVWQAVPERRQADGPNDPDEALAQRLAGLLPPDLTQLFYSLCLHGKGELGLAPDEYAALTMVMLRMLAFAPAAAEKKTLKIRPELAPVLVAPAAPAATQSAVAPASANHTPASHTPANHTPASPAAVASNALADVWCALVKQLIEADAITALARELALQSVLVEQSATGWAIQVSNPALNQSNARERLQAALLAHGHAVELSVRPGSADDTPARRNAAAAQARLRDAEQTLRNDPFVQAMMRDFGGKIVPASVQAL